MPQLGHENQREIEASHLVLAQKHSQTVPYRKIFRAANEVISTPINPGGYRLRDQWMSQALYLPVSSSGFITYTFYSNVNGTLANAATVTRTYTVDAAGVVSTGGAAIAAGTLSVTPTVNASVSGYEYVLSGAGLVAGATIGAFLLVEVYPMTGFEEFINLRPMSNAALTAPEGTVI